MKSKADILTITTQQARRLLPLFFDGATTIGEERQLYAYFRTTSDLPDDMRRYALMFGWLEKGMPEPRATRERTSGRTLWAFIASAAAMVAIVVTLGVSYTSRVETQYALYEGSYVVRNGHKITDLRSIMPELQRAETLADASIADMPAATGVKTDAMTDEMLKAVDEILDF